jgi:hypothetical protein
MKPHRLAVQLVLVVFCFLLLLGEWSVARSNKPLI